MTIAGAIIASISTTTANIEIGCKCYNWGVSSLYHQLQRTGVYIAPTSSCIYSI